MSSPPGPLTDAGAEADPGASRPSVYPDSRPAGVRAGAAALLLFVTLAAFHTWPLASAPGTWSRNDNGDAMLNEWTIAWVAHQLPRDPAHLFDANIFYPERRTLTFSEHLLPQALLVSPVLWAGGSPVLAYNLCLLEGLALTAWAMCLVIRRWTGSWWAGLIAGCLAGYNASSLTRLAHIQSQHLEFLPLALLALDRLFALPRVRHALALGGWFALQSLTSGYFLAFTSVAMVVSAGVRPVEWMGARFRRVAPRLLVALATALLLLMPFLVAYWHVRQEQGLVRTLRDVAQYLGRLPGLPRHRRAGALAVEQGVLARRRLLPGHRRDGPRGDRGRERRGAEGSPRAHVAGDRPRQLLLLVRRRLSAVCVALPRGAAVPGCPRGESLRPVRAARRRGARGVRRRLVAGARARQSAAHGAARWRC